MQQIGIKNYLFIYIWYRFKTVELCYIAYSHAVEVADDSEEEFAYKCGALVGADFPRQMLTNIQFLCIYLCPV